MAASLYKSADLTERRALIKTRFSLADACAMCGAGRDEDAHPCPSCRAPDVDLRADRFSCEVCGAAGDQISFVQMAHSWGVGRTIGRIEDWLDARAGGRP